MNKKKLSIVIIAGIVILALGIGFFAGRISKQDGSGSPDPTQGMGQTDTSSPTQGTGETDTPSPAQSAQVTGTADPARDTAVTNAVDTRDAADETGTGNPTDEAGKTDTADPTAEPGVTDTAEPTGAQEPADTAEPTDAPEPTNTAGPTKAPEPTNTAEPTKAPEPTNTADPTKAPEPTQKPDPTATPTPAVVKAENGTPYEVHGRLKVKGTKLVDKNGDEYRLRGVSTHGLAWFPGYVNKDSFKTLRDSWGVNCIRLAMYTAEYNGYCSGGNKEELKKLVSNGVKYATELGMYVIIDWHILSDSNPMNNKDEALKFFAEMSEKYADYGNVIFEICNEPNGGTGWSQIKKYAEEVIPVIRKNASKAIIVVGTPTWSQEVDKAAADPIKGYDNIMYTIHFYAATHKDDLRKRMQNAVKSGIALFCTEFGTCDASGSGGNDFNESQKWIDAMESSGVSYCIWNLSNKSETSALISSGCSKTSGWKDSDLSESGKWYAKLLRSKTGADGSDIGKSDDPADDSGDSGSGNKEDNNTGDDAGNGNDPGNDNESLTAKAGNVSATVKKTGGWDDGKAQFSQYVITITNSGNSNFENWKITLEFSGKYTLSQSWSGTFEEKEKTLIVKPADYNSTISAGQSAEIGIIVSGGDDLKIKGIKLN